MKEYDTILLFYVYLLFFFSRSFSLVIDNLKLTLSFSPLKLGILIIK